MSVASQVISPFIYSPSMSAPDASTTAQAKGHDLTQPAHVEGIIATEDDAALYADNDADFISLDGQSSTASMTSSVMDYRYENGRRYHAFREGQYVIPNDEREQDRLDLHHHIYTMLLDGELYRAPISDNISRILDIGTGTGAWAIDMADKFPDAQVIGTDLSPIQPNWTPPNCTFEVDDFTSPWRFSAPFDLVHARGLEGSVADYPALFKSAREALVPGGYFEVAEATVGCFTDDETKEKAPSFYKWVEHLKDASSKFGRPMGIAQNMRKWMEEAGFEDVHEEIRKVCLSSPFLTFSALAASLSAS